MTALIPPAGALLQVHFAWPFPYKTIFSGDKEARFAFLMMAGKFTVPLEHGCSRWFLSDKLPSWLFGVDDTCGVSGVVVSGGGSKSWVGGISLNLLSYSKAWSKPDYHTLTQLLYWKISKKKKKLWTNLNEKPQLIRYKRHILYNVGARQATSAQMYISRCLPKEVRHTEFKPRLFFRFGILWWLVNCFCGTNVFVSGSADPSSSSQLSTCNYADVVKIADSICLSDKATKFSNDSKFPGYYSREIVTRKYFFPPLPRHCLPPANYKAMCSAWDR